MEKLIEIKDDLFDIANRIKSIDADYKIYFNGDTKSYELHNAKSHPSYQLTFPYKTLDKRAVDYTLKSEVKNKERILKEIEQQNIRQEQEYMKNLFEKTMSGIGL